MWDTFYRDGGWPMVPTSVFGFLLIAAAVLYVLRPERRFVSLVVALGVTTFGAGLLGTSVGIVKSFHYLPQVAAEKQLTVAALGCAESLHNLVLGLMLVVLAAVICAVAALRATRVRAPNAIGA